MIKKIKAYFARRKKNKQLSEVYTYVQAGAKFLQFYLRDIDKKYNRKQRKQIRRSLIDDGKFENEILETYIKNYEKVLAQLKGEKHGKKTKRS